MKTWHYLMRHTLTETLVNAALNAGIGVYVFKGLDKVPVIGMRSVAVDAIATGLILPIVVGLIVSIRTQHHLRSGVRLAPYHSLVSTWSMRALPDKLLPRVSALGGFGVLFALIATGACLLLEVESIAFSTTVLLKALFAGVLAAYTAYVSCLIAIHQRD